MEYVMDAHSPEYTSRPVTVIEVMFENGRFDSLVLEADHRFRENNGWLICELGSELVRYHLIHVASFRVQYTTRQTRSKPPVSPV